MRKPGRTCPSHEHPASVERTPLSDTALDRAEQFFQAMGDRGRLRLLELLTRREWCVSELVEAMREKFSTVSQRLRVLRNAGLVVRRRQGTHLFYALADRHVVDLIQNALAHADELETGRAGEMEEPKKEGENE